MPKNSIFLTFSQKTWIESARRIPLSTIRRAFDSREPEHAKISRTAIEVFPMSISRWSGKTKSASSCRADGTSCDIWIHEQLMLLDGKRRRGDGVPTVARIFHCLFARLRSVCQRRARGLLLERFFAFSSKSIRACMEVSTWRPQKLVSTRSHVRLLASNCAAQPVKRWTEISQTQLFAVFLGRGFWPPQEEALVSKTRKICFWKSQRLVAKGFVLFRWIEPVIIDAVNGQLHNSMWFPSDTVVWRSKTAGDENSSESQVAESTNFTVFLCSFCQPFNDPPRLSGFRRSLNWLFMCASINSFSGKIRQI